jgi:hypothetical protein
MIRELQWDVKNQIFKGTTQPSCTEDSPDLPFDEYGFYFTIKYGFDGVVTERYYELQPGDIFANENAENFKHVRTFKSIPRRALAVTDFYITYSSRPFIYLDKHPEIQTDARLLAASIGFEIRYTVASKKIQVGYMHDVNPRCRFLIETSENAAYHRSKESFPQFIQDQTAALEEFKAAAGTSVRDFGVDKLSGILLFPVYMSTSRFGMMIF